MIPSDSTARKRGIAGDATHTVWSADAAVFTACMGQMYGKVAVRDTPGMAYLQRYPVRRKCFVPQQRTKR
jgi:hypothetical protein